MRPFDGIEPKALHLKNDPHAPHGKLYVFACSFCGAEVTHAPPPRRRWHRMICGHWVSLPRLKDKLEADARTAKRYAKEHAHELRFIEEAVRRGFAIVIGFKD